MANDSFRVIVIGGGVSGLTTALAAHRLGIRVDVYERNPAITDLGAGIAIGPNAAALFEGLGVGDALDEISARPKEKINLVYRDHDQSKVHFTGYLNTDKRSFYCHRAELVQTIAKFLPEDQLHLNKGLQKITQDESSITAHFTDGSSTTGHLLIGADGIRSAVRSTWNQERPVFSNQVVVRNVVERDDLPAECLEYFDHGNVWLGPGHKHIVTFPLRRGRTIAIGAILPSFADNDWEESWQIRGDVDVQPLIEEFHPSVKIIFEKGHCQSVFGLYERPPLTGWINGRIVLVGDAAHAMLPHQGQGGSQAVEDAVILAAAIAAASKESDSLPKLTKWLEVYQEVRKPRADHAAVMSRETGKAFDELLFSEEGINYLKKCYAWINENDLVKDVLKAVDTVFSSDQDAAREMASVLKDPIFGGNA